MRLTTSGTPRHIAQSIIGVITLDEVIPELKRERIRVFGEGKRPEAEFINGYLAVLTVEPVSDQCEVPRVERLRDIDHFRNGDIVVIEPESGFVRSLYRPAEMHHSLFATERCNSNCLMCSQPPKDKDDTTLLTARNLQLIQLMKPAPPYLTITGGEPTLLGKNLFTLLRSLNEHMPETEIHMLTNGRTFAWADYVKGLAEVSHSRFSVGIPLYSDFAPDHDYIVQAKGAFDQTIAGFHQLARYGIRSELRVVLHQLTIPRLTKLMEYIYRNLTFVEHVALMGLEHIGYTPRNIDKLWIDPYDYQEELEEAVEYLTQRDMAVSLYNHQLCVLRPSLWRYAKKSISDWKNLYLPECGRCAVFGQCGGLFKWAVAKHSEHIHPL
ncbi:MAG: His-Xaa-Ser system radical SAM maturase HxsC [Silvibacterium sp.]